MSFSPEDIQNFKHFHEVLKLVIRVPEYQRAFAWTDKQVKTFVRDLINYKEKGSPYYYGHFILKHQKLNYYEIIDGQQRLTLAALFLLVCHDLAPELREPSHTYFLNHFETASYDRKTFNKIKADIGPFLDKKAGELLDDPTLSIKKINAALHCLHKELQERRAEIPKLVKVLTNASVSVHLVDNPVLARQIYEFTNDRGVNLSLLEVAKAKLMKFVFESNHSSGQKRNIKLIQMGFGEISREEKAEQ